MLRWMVIATKDCSEPIPMSRRCRVSPELTGFLSVTLATTVSNSRQAEKHEAMWIHNGLKRKSKDMQTWNAYQFHHNKTEKTILSLFCFDKFGSFQLQPVTRKTRPSWNELISIMHLRIAYQNPVGTLIILADSSRGCQREFCVLLLKLWE